MKISRDADNTVSSGFAFSEGPDSFLVSSCAEGDCALPDSESELISREQPEKNQCHPEKKTEDIFVHES